MEASKCPFLLFYFSKKRRVTYGLRFDFPGAVEVTLSMLHFVVNSKKSGPECHTWWHPGPE